MKVVLSLMLAFGTVACSREETADEIYERRLAEIRSNAMHERIAEMEARESGRLPVNTDQRNDPEHLISTLSTQQAEDIALAVNLSGNLCGRFVGAVPAGSMILVECQEYRKKPGHYVRYWVRGLGENQNMQIEKAFVLDGKSWTSVNTRAK
ncbi:hypothetical protein QLH51_14855 [Sphingomonas sp. 2R-10]|uniref:hypothetical protein n=1 Tax=Sphingomonas sp. 2R-10 TaxID=3045148 RepID=UPI000F794D79|nr:hypothetical protein [Sphingomonas sp. 2R-10]MDJ0278075.1 hypothetical protein [Sphingomonas sp. 2R-10]